uniref:Uncharacterized protein n=1 Tax=Avena sativa TaxID=4498 RepID=A0ACD5TCJ8_AVESA
MGQGSEVKTRPDPKVEIQEKGEVFFFYRPKVDKEEAHSPDDVQRMYVVLRPESVPERGGKEGKKRKTRHGGDDDDKGGSGGGDEGGHGKEEVNVEERPLLRLIVMGKKSLPDPAKHGRPFWGYVDLVTTDVEDVKDALKGEEYETKTRGKRHRQAARALGEGVYRIVKHEAPGGGRAHTHLVYKLELPEQGADGGAGEPQEAMNVEPEASFLLQIKNPEQGGGFGGLQGKRKAAFPEHLQGRFGSNRYAPADPPDLLNYEGCELLLISASDDVEEELGLELQTETEKEAGTGTEREGEGRAGAGCSDLVKMFGEVADVKPLLSGSWD